MKDILWNKYCKFYNKSFEEQIEYNESRMKNYFKKWRKSYLAKLLCKKSPEILKEVPLTTYSDYEMLHDFGSCVDRIISKKARGKEEFLKDYYCRTTSELGSSLDKYMTEPYYVCMRTTGTTGKSKWVVHGKTYWDSFALGSKVAPIFACSDSWGETNLKVGDKALNMTASIPYVSGWANWATRNLVKMVPSIKVAENVKDMREKYDLILKAIRSKEKIVLGGGIGSLFYMICNYFADPLKFYKEYYPSLDFGLKKTLLFLKIIQLELGKKERRIITDFLPLKGVLIAGMEARLYLDFFKSEFGLEPLHIYGSTEAGTLMRGDPDRKSDLVPDLSSCYFEFKNSKGQIINLNEVKKGDIYDLIITPFGSILFRYDIEDLLRVVDFRDDGMPIFEFEGRQRTLLRLYSWYRVSGNMIVQALSMAGLNDSDKWSVTKVLKPKEHLHFLMEKKWQYSEKEAEKILYKCLLKTSKSYTGRTINDYVKDFRILNPSEVIKVEYLRPGTFLRYQARRAREGSPLGQYKPPKIVPPEKEEIFQKLRNA
jgi:hypothetical protein